MDNLGTAFSDAFSRVARRNVMAGCAAPGGLAACPTIAAEADPLIGLRARIKAPPPRTYPAIAENVVAGQRAIFLDGAPWRGKLDTPMLMVASGRGHSVGWTWTETPAEMITSGGDRYTLSGAVPAEATAWIFNARSQSNTLSSALKWRTDREADTAAS